MPEIYLRPVEVSDAIKVISWENDQANWGVSETKSEYTFQEILDLIESLKEVEVAKQARYIIVDKSTNVQLGAVDLFEIDFETEEAGVGILVDGDSNRNKGIGARALKLLEELCEDELGISILKAKVHANNEASVRLFEKLRYSKKKLTDQGQLNNGDYIETLIFEKCLKK